MPGWRAGSAFKDSHAQHPGAGGSHCSRAARNRKVPTATIMQYRQNVVVNVMRSMTIGRAEATLTYRDPAERRPLHRSSSTCLRNVVENSALLARFRTCSGNIPRTASRWHRRYSFDLRRMCSGVWKWNSTIALLVNGSRVLNAGACREQIKTLSRMSAGWRVERL